MSYWRNLTPHPITFRKLDNEDVTVPPCGTVVRVSSTPGEQIATGCAEHGGIPIHASPVWGVVENLPEPIPDTFFIVSSLVLGHVSGRPDVIAPGTGPMDGSIRDKDGHVIAVTRFIAAA